jgi:hypothetical protein
MLQRAKRVSWPALWSRTPGANEEREYRYVRERSRDGNRVLACRAPDEFRARLRAHAAAGGVSVSQYLRTAVENEMSRNDLQNGSVISPPVPYNTPVQPTHQRQAPGLAEAFVAGFADPPSLGIARARNNRAPRSLAKPAEPTERSSGMRERVSGDKRGLETCVLSTSSFPTAKGVTGPGLAENKSTTSVSAGLRDRSTMPALRNLPAPRR